MAVAESVVRDILRDPFAYSGWTIQGLGMIRLELNPDGSERLHIWDPSTTINDVTSAHDHPWDMLESQIYYGNLANQRYSIGDTGEMTMRAARLVCGVGSHLISPPELVGVTVSQPREEYGPGDRYSMTAEEFHESFPTPGTVTVIRKRVRPDKNVATICWAGEKDWNEEGFTRIATKAEITHFIGLAALREAQSN